MTALAVAFGLVADGRGALAGTAAATVELFRHDGRERPHPRRWSALLVVPKAIDENAHLQLSYWRTATRRPDQGSISFDLEIRRDTDGDGATDSVEHLSVGGQVEDFGYQATVGPLDPLRAGDLVLVESRLERMPQKAFRQVQLEVALLDSPSTCPEPSPTAGDVEPPKKIFFPSPQYSERARKARIQGFVVVETVVDCDGRVGRFRLRETLPLGLVEASLDALAQWRLEPARIDGVPVSSFLLLTINFRLQAAGSEAGEALEGSVTVEASRPRLEPEPRD